MANELLFRQGKLADLKANESTNKVAGSINFTTDEPAIYLDVAEENGEIVRKRIGSYIARFASIEELKTKLTEENLTPSQEVLYYAINENALLVYTGSEWKQLNGTNSEDGGSAIDSLQEQITIVNNAVQANTSKISSLETTQGDVSSRVEALEDIVGTEDGEGGTLVDRVTENESTLASQQQTLNSLQDQITQTALKSELQQLETDLTQNISNSINAANAMRYMGTIGVDEDNNVVYPTGEISVGDTYVATNKFLIGETTVAPGDLVIAKGAEENNVIVGEVSWDVVTTGYNSAHNPKLVINPEINALTLNDYSDTEISSIGLTGEGNVVVTADPENNQFVFGLQWGSF